MSIRRERICDICGRTLCKSGDIIIKRRWTSWHETGWSKLDVCKWCADRIDIFIQNEINKEEEVK